MTAAGTLPTNLTNNAANDRRPGWSPDGTKIAFITDRDGNFEVYTMNADGTNQTSVSTNVANDGGPAWSPDGTKIAFVSDLDGDDEIFVMNADGTDQTQLTFNTASDSKPAWSPDGTAILFTTDRDANFEIYVMNPDGSFQLNVTNNPASDVLQDWKADSSSIVFQSNRDGNDEIYSIDGIGVVTRLTYNAAFDGAPSWSRSTGLALDFDLDGCTDAKEAGSDQTLGGRRNPQHFWDFYDVPAGGALTRDKVVSGNDIFATIGRFNSTDEGPGDFDRNSDPLSTPNPLVIGQDRENYHPAYDRGGIIGPNVWNLAAANGAVAGTDIFNVIGQFGHSCA